MRSVCHSSGKTARRVTECQRVTTKREYDRSDTRRLRKFNRGKRLNSVPLFVVYDLRIDLSVFNIRMSQELRNEIQVASFSECECCKRMSCRVHTNMFRESRRVCPRLQVSPESAVSRKIENSCRRSLSVFIVRH